MNLTYAEFLYLLAQLPTLTAWGYLSIDNPAYAVERKRLLDSFAIYKRCEEWIDDNGLQHHDNTMQLKHAIERDIGDYIPHGCAVFALQIVFCFDIENEAKGITFADYPDLIEESYAVLQQS